MMIFFFPGSLLTGMISDFAYQLATRAAYVAYHIPSEEGT